MSRETNREFRVGDRVRVVSEDISHRAPLGSTGVLVARSRELWVKWNDPTNCSGTSRCEFPLYKLELATGSLDTLAVDDVVVDDLGNEFTVVDVHGKVIDIADSDGHFDSSFTVKDLRDGDWTVEGVTEEVEFSMDEVAKALGVPVDKLKIRKD